MARKVYHRGVDDGERESRVSGKEARQLLRTVIACCPFCKKFDRDGSFVLMPEDHEMAPLMWACRPDARKNGGPA